MSFVAAQSLVVTGDTFFTGNLVDQIDHHLDIKNTSVNPITIKCQKTNLTLPLLIDMSTGDTSFAESYYCFASNCYSASSTSPSSSAVLSAGQQISFDNSPPDADAYSGYYNAYGASGIAEVQYCFYDVANSSDETCVTITYDCSGATGINNFTELTKMSEFYPNPANGVTNLAFNGTKAQLRIIDILGNEVNSIQLEGSGIKRIDLTHMSKGIYFGKLLVANKLTAIKKLIVQ